MIGRVLLVVLTIGIAGSMAVAKSPAEDEPLRRLAVETMTARGPAADRVIAGLRRRGPQALEPLFAMRKAMIKRRASSVESQRDEALAADLEKIKNVIDRVASQRYAHASRLYWYTDLDEAKAAAAESGKPILSLRMLGKLTDEFSCANSRFFRTTLYANREVAGRMRENFVLHWQSVRPVPLVTIDFGDGRKLQRTLTGNSAHYVLAADGTPLDVLPGLYGPRQFLAWLDAVEKLHGHVARLSPEERKSRLRQYHAGQIEQIARRWADDLEAVAPKTVLGARDRVSALTKATTNEHWKQISLLPSHAVALDAISRRIIRDENTGLIQPGEVAVTKDNVEWSIQLLVRSLQRSIAEDGVRNEYTLHRKAHEWFAAGEAPGDVKRFNNRVYAELFLMPMSDPWLGLAPREAYTALENGGVRAD